MSRQAQLSGLYTGFLSFGTEYLTLLSIKHILHFVIIALSVFRSQIVDRVKKFTPKQNQTLNMLTLMLNVLAGLTVLFLSAYTSVLASLPTP